MKQPPDSYCFPLHPGGDSVLGFPLHSGGDSVLGFPLHSGGDSVLGLRFPLPSTSSSSSSVITKTAHDVKKKKKRGASYFCVKHLNQEFVGKENVAIL